MTTFVLVPGAHTGGWVWEEVGTRLRASGATAHPVTLTGMGDGLPAGPGTDLPAHADEVVRLIDDLPDPDVVLVCHGYGVFPALGAAAQRPQRIGRIVLVDTPPPREGDSAAALLPGTDGRLPSDDGRLPAPSAEDWGRQGGTEGLSGEDLTRLARRAAPQPRRTLTDPLRLHGAPPGVPTTGVLCTANGSSIATVQALVDLGDPRLTALADSRVTFFELHTGHWPMLSAPGEPAQVLLRAAAGEGHRLTAADDGPPPHLRPFLLDVPERPRERTDRLDLHPPEADEPRPAVLFVHGGPVPAGAKPTPRDWPAFVGYGRYVAGLGAVGATVEHRLHAVGDYPRAAEDVAAAVDRLRADPRVDEERVALWFFSGGALLAADWLAAPPPWLRCIAATYPMAAPMPNWGMNDGRFRPVDAVRYTGRLPLVVTRVGRERPEIAATVEEFLRAAEQSAAEVEVVDAPDAVHGFETLDHTEEARHAVRHAVRSVLAHLGVAG